MTHPGFWIGLGLIGGYPLVLRFAGNRMFARERAHSAQPFTEKLKRPAGESLRIELDRIRDEISEKALFLTMTVMGPAIVMILLPIKPYPFQLIFCGVLLLLAVSGGLRWWAILRELRKQLRKVRLGFAGERYVGEELNGLMTRGYRVFHDFQVDWMPNERVFNIDHIAIGPEGLFVVETKTRRKLKNEATQGQKNYEVIYNGRTLKYPDWESDEAILQVKWNAEDLAKWLTGTAAVRVDGHLQGQGIGEGAQWKECGNEPALSRQAERPDPAGDPAAGRPDRGALPESRRGVIRCGESDSRDRPES